MNLYESKPIGQWIDGNPYNGRGIILGQTPNGRRAVAAYFIMGRSANSRNRVFRAEGDALVIYPYDAARVEDPSLILYAPVRVYENHLIVTNGDQTDTICDGLAAGREFRDCLRSRTFEPDAPNLTPRISGIIDLPVRSGAGHNVSFGEDVRAGRDVSAGNAPTEQGAVSGSGAPRFTYSLSILKSADAAGSGCNRFTYDYESLPGVGHFIHTYLGDGDPLPSFTGEPRRVAIPDDVRRFAADIWEALDENNRISLYVRSVDLFTGAWEGYLLNGNELDGDERSR